jgi:hypothetical protein
MATIIQKGILNSTGSSNILVLDPREMYVQKFDLGDWNEIRVGLAMSVTAATTDNSPYVIESLPASSTPDLRNSYMFGLFSGEPAYFPKPGSSFVGVVGSTTGQILQFKDDISSITAIADATSFGDSRYRIATTVNENYKLAYTSPFAQNSTFNIGSTRNRYTGLLETGIITTMSFSVKNKGQSGQYIDIIRDSNANKAGSALTWFYTDLSAQKLSQLNSLISASAATGIYYNSTMNETGSPIDIPNNFLIYFPFYNNKLRIHSLLIEKYS